MPGQILYAMTVILKSQQVTPVLGRRIINIPQRITVTSAWFATMIPGRDPGIMFPWIYHAKVAILRPIKLWI